MAKKINSRDLFEQEDLFRGVRDSADKTIQKLTQLKEGMVASAKEMKAAFSGLKMDNLKDLEKFVKLAEQANKLSKQSIEVDKQKKVSTEQKKKSELELLKIEQEKEKLKQQQMRTNKMVTTEQERQNKQAEKQKKLAQDQANAYKKLEKNTRDLKNESKRLGAEMLALEQKGRKNSAEYNKLAQEYNKVTRAAQKGDQQLKKLDKTVGDNFRNVGNYKSALAGLSGALGTLGIAFGAGQIFRSTFGILANFDQAQADLAAISGKTKDELAGLTAQAKELGATTQFSATQITEMQTELAKLGFSTDQISDSTEAVSNFAAATGADIPRAAALAGSALRAFNLPATEMERVVSTLGVATTKSALDFSKLEAGLSTVAPVAASFGFSIEDTTALLGQLSNAGFDASSAATATRNILLNLADSTGDLAQELGRPIKNADDLAAALQELDARGIDLAESLELTDKRSVAAFNTFIKQSGSLVQLRDSITDVNDELKDMAAKRLDSIQGQLTLLSSAWEGFILGTNDSTGASEKLKVAIGFLAENLSTIMDVVIRLIRFWAVYKTTTIAVNQVNKLMAINFSNVGRSIMAMIPGTKAYTVQMRAMRIAGQKTNVSLKVLGQTMKRMPWGLVIAGATELYFALKGDEEATDDLASSTDKAKQETADFASRLADSTSEFISHIEQLKNTNYESEERIKLIDEMNKKYGTHLQNIKDETAFQVQLNQAVADYLAFQKLRLRSEIGKEKSKEAMQKSFEASETLLQQFGDRLTEEQKKIVVSTGDLPIEIMREFMGAQQMISKGYGANDKNIQRLLQRGQEVYNLQAQIKQSNTELQRYAVSELEIQEALKKFNYKGPAANVSNYGKSVKGAAGSVKEFNTELKGTPDYLDRQRELLFEFYEINAQAGIEATERRIKAEFEKQVKSIRDNGTFQSKELNKLIEQKAKQEKVYLKQKEAFEIGQLNKQYEREKEARKQALIDQRDQLLKQNDISVAAKKEINKNYDIEAEKLVEQEKVRYKDLQQEITNLENDTNKKIADINRKKYDDLNANAEKFNDDLEKYAEDQLKIQEEQAKEELKKDKELNDAKREFIRITADYAIKQSEKVIEQIDKEIAAAEKQADTLRELAKEGNINAQQSLAEQEKIIAESNKRKEKELKRQQRIRLAQSIYETYSKNLESLQPGEKTSKALSDTIRDTTLLQAFINSLPGFEKGTEDTGKDGRGVDGKGGMLSVLHPNERVIPKSLNDQLKGLSNEELTRIATEYQNGKIVNSAKGNEALNFAVLVNELQDLKKVIKDKPETNVEVGQITQSAMEIVQRTKKGNTVVYNRFKVK